MNSDRPTPRIDHDTVKDLMQAFFDLPGLSQAREMEELSAHSRSVIPGTLSLDSVESKDELRGMLKALYYFLYNAQQLLCTEALPVDNAQRAYLAKIERRVIKAGITHVQWECSLRGYTFKDIFGDPRELALKYEPHLKPGDIVKGKPIKGQQ